MGGEPDYRPKTNFGSRVHQTIAASYRDQKLCRGWRLLYNPEAVLDLPRKLALIGLNPGGSNPERFDGLATPKEHCAYLCEPWGRYSQGQSPHQVRAREICEACGVRPIDALAGNLIPFRSKDWKTLGNKNEALKLGRIVWKCMFARGLPSFVVAYGQACRLEIENILDVKNRTLIPFGPSVASFGDFDEKGIYVGIPHLSYRFFNERAFKQVLATLQSKAG